MRATEMTIMKFKSVALALAATAAFGAATAPAQLSAQAKTLVYCPSSDQTGCTRIEAALGASNVTRASDLSITTLKPEDYAAVIIPSFGDGPYAHLAGDAVKSKLRPALTGRVAVWSGTPDQGGDNRTSKEDLIRRLNTWAVGGYDAATKKNTGLVILLDQQPTANQYNWLNGIAGVSVQADFGAAAYDTVQWQVSNGTTVLGAPFQYSKMAKSGLASPNSPGAVQARGVIAANGNKLAALDKIVFVTFAGGRIYTPPVTCTNPSITTQPAVASKQSGQSASFSVIASGTATLAYQWRKNETNIADAAGSTYSIPSVTVADAGRYDVVVSNGCGSVTSTAATLSVNRATATVTLGGLNSTYDGSAKAATATTTPAGLTVNIAYSQNGTAVASPTDAGSYDVVATVDDPNYAGSTNGTLTITAKPVTGSFTADNKVYDGGTSATVLTRGVSGAIANDAVSLSGGTASFADKNVETGKEVTLSGASLAGPHAGNYSLSSVGTATASISLWTHKGFYSPVDMGGVVNTVKNGSTVPLKFEVFAGATELKDANVISAKSARVTCIAAAEDTVELTATGGTSLRFDTTADQFVYNWQTPKVVGACYEVTITTQDGTPLTAKFKLK